MKKIDDELIILKSKLIKMWQDTKYMIENSVDGVINKDITKIRNVYNTEKTVNMAEVDIENTCISLLALYQPEAEHLRYITMIMKMCNDYERAADHAMNIAQKAEMLLSYPDVIPLPEISIITKKALYMFEEGINGFLNHDGTKMIETCKMDTEVDNLRSQVIKELIKYITLNPQRLEPGLLLIQITQNLERLADLATNIAEDVEYIVTGEDIKHHLKNQK